MSLKERAACRSPLGSSTLPAGLSRSKSFGGLLAHKRSSSGAGLREPDNGRSTWTGGYVLGQAYNSPGGTRKFLGISPKTKIPKSPRPQRARDVATAVARGLRECVSITEEDIGGFRTSLENISVNSQQSQGKLYELEKQLKGAERHLKKLEYQLSKLEELQEQYALQQKLRDGVRSMAYAYVLSPGKEKESALHKVRSGYRECTEILCALEAQLEQMMGTLQFQMKGIQGFARLCPGDIFEITIKHGGQKWKSRGRVNKDGQQSWDNPRAVFKGLLGEVLFIKAVEVKTLGKQVLLGNKFCETRDLFCAHPQLMTVNLNPSGSLKLNVVVTWNPIDSVEEVVSLRAHAVPGAGSPGNRRRSSPSPSTTLQNVLLETAAVGSAGSSYGSDGLSPDHDSGQSSTSAKSSTVDSASPLSEYRNMLNHSAGNNHSPGDLLYPKSLRHSVRTDSSDSIDRGSSDSREGRDGSPLHSERDIISDPSGNFTLRRRVENGVEKRYSLQVPHHMAPSGDPTLPRHHQHDRPRTADFSYLLSGESRGSAGNTGLSGEVGLTSLTRWTGWRDHDDMSLRDVIQRLSSCLEDIQGQYPELHVVELHVIELEELVRSSRSRRGSNSSDISLSVESALECFDFLNTETDEDTDFVDAVHDSTVSLDPGLTARTCDSGIASLAHRLRSTSPPPSFGLVTGSPQIDLTLLTHLNYCQKLVENLGSFGPMRWRERHALEKLQKQAKIIGKIIRHAKNGDTASVTGVGELSSHPHLQALWEKVTDRGLNLCVTADEVMQGLEPECRAVLKDKTPGFSFKVTKLLICQMLDIQAFDPAAIVTAYQFQLHFRMHDRTLAKHMEELSEEVNIVQSFQTGETSVINATLSQMPCSHPPRSAVTALGHLLLDANPDVKTVATHFLEDVTPESPFRQQVVNVMTETLESSDMMDRRAACAALAILQALESIPQLAYLVQADDSEDVRNDAKEALLALGKEGQEAYQQSQLSSHGFQGLSVK